VFVFKDPLNAGNSLETQSVKEIRLLMAKGERFELSVAQTTFSLFTIVWLERADLCRDFKGNADT
jgi:hypothetical protein